uniref:Uncharacterized protein n=1 Tax=Romanomermis culicivorax TaxID=13658 RepID=A0A915JYP9_ROMCU
MDHFKMNGVLRLGNHFDNLDMVKKSDHQGATKAPSVSDINTLKQEVDKDDNFSIKLTRDQYDALELVLASYSYEEKALYKMTCKLSTIRSACAIPQLIIIRSFVPVPNIVTVKV